MEISFSQSFKKAFNKRIKGTGVEDDFWNQLEFFSIDPYTPRLKTHKLSGKLKDLWSFSIEYNLRVVFYFTNDNPKKAILVDIGTHEEVY